MLLLTECKSFSGDGSEIENNGVKGTTQKGCQMNCSALVLFGSLRKEDGRQQKPLKIDRSAEQSSTEQSPAQHNPLESALMLYRGNADTHSLQ